MKKKFSLPAAIAASLVLCFTDTSFAGESESCTFKVKNSTGGRVRVCEYNSGDDTNAFGRHDKVLNDGDSAQFDCETSTCNVRVQWYWDGALTHGFVDSCATGYRKTFFSSDTTALQACNDIEIFMKSGITNRETEDAVQLSIW